MLTYKSVNQELQKLDPTAQLVKSFCGRYHFFLGESIRKSPVSSVMIPRLNYLSLQSWIFEFTTMQEESNKRGS